MKRFGNLKVQNKLPVVFAIFFLDGKDPERAQTAFESMPYGRFFIVDDAESNLYVAKGLMKPYRLAIETVTSGFDAIASFFDKRQ